MFVEVKARRTDRFGIPAEAVTPTKQRRLRTLARRYLEATDARPGALRFDVVEHPRRPARGDRGRVLSSRQPRTAQATSATHTSTATATIR